jgi:hypothetical protein
MRFQRVFIEKSLINKNHFTNKYIHGIRENAYVGGAKLYSGLIPQNINCQTNKSAYKYAYKKRSCESSVYSEHKNI